ncbi:MAG: prepilin peptidase [Proteobacteria bacterium]|nr:prepilin peptidase [Pseudomonadota bacterium]
MSEFSALLDLLRMLLVDPRTAVLFALLIAGALKDCLSMRIPNSLTYGGATFALIYSAIVPFSTHAGFWWAVGGLFAGLLLLLPLYMLRVMGAGDVKLMAMAGAFLGLSETPLAVLWVFTAGGLFAVVHVLVHRQLGRLAHTLREVAGQLTLSAAAGTRPASPTALKQSVGKLPYGMAIAAGTISYVVARQIGYA